MTNLEKFQTENPSVKTIEESTQTIQKGGRRNSILPPLLGVHLHMSIGTTTFCLDW